MFENYDIRSRSTGTEQSELKPGSVVHIPPAVTHRIGAVTDSHFLLVR